MADGLNKVMLIGNLGAEPELRQTKSGPVMSLRLATSETYLDKEKQRQERTEWHSVTMWGKRAEGLAKFLSKGARVYVEGGIRSSSYEVDGQKRYKTEIVAQNLLLCGGAGGEKKPATPASAPFPEVEEDDIPF